MNALGSGQARHLQVAVDHHQGTAWAEFLLYRPGQRQQVGRIQVLLPDLNRADTREAGLAQRRGKRSSGTPGPIADQIEPEVNHDAYFEAEWITPLSGLDADA